MKLPFEKNPTDIVVALVGCPNVGKTTLFNLLTGENQHVGNWSGKTVSIATGRYNYKGKTYIIVDLPGTYSLDMQSPEEQVAVDFMKSGQADCVIAVVDATSVERTLLPALQVMEFQQKLAVCVNLMDEAERLQIEMDLRTLEGELGVPTVGISAKAGSGVDKFRELVRNLNDGFLPMHPRQWFPENEAGKIDDRTASLSRHVEEIVRRSVKQNRAYEISGIDKIVLGKISGPICLFMMLFLILWLTVKAANYPTTILETAFLKLEAILKRLVIDCPYWLSGVLVDGIYETTTCVISVMLPPVVIFFVLFSVLEEFGLLPRAAFLLDHCFERCGTCGKQALTMAMGFGCNSVGVMGTRIISSPQSRLIAILTNSFVPCNGRFPAMILLISMFFGQKSWICALVLSGFLLLSVGITLLTTKALSGTLLNTKDSRFIMELPSYRRPGLYKILSKTLIRRIGSVLTRAVIVSIPTGMLIWLGQYINVGDVSALAYFSNIMDPLGRSIGINGVILTAFFISFPANELLIPSVIILMNANITAGANSDALRELFMSNGWTLKTVICMLTFLIFHWPCSTTCLTIRKETGSWMWTLVSVLLPTGIGALLCSLISRI